MHIQIRSSLAKVTPELLDFNVHSRLGAHTQPGLSTGSSSDAWIAARIGKQEHPQETPGGLEDLSARISPEQIRDAFRAAGYRRQEVEAFSEGC